MFCFRVFFDPHHRGLRRLSLSHRVPRSFERLLRSFAGWGLAKEGTTVWIHEVFWGNIEGVVQHPWFDEEILTWFHAHRRSWTGSKPGPR